MTKPRPLSDTELITWGVILERRRQQAARGITLLQQPHPPCPTCGQPVSEAATVEDFGQGQLTVKPCGHNHDFNVGDVYRLSDHIAEMVDLLEQASRRPAGERGWSTADIVREAAARTTPNNPAASSDTADNPLQQRIADAVAPILDEYPEHNRIDEHEHVVSEITAAVLAVMQPELDALARVREYAATSDDDGIRTRETILGIAGDWPGPETEPTGFVPFTPPYIPRTGDPSRTLVVEPYRTDRGQPAWLFRCWGTDTCDGWLSLDHTTRQSAERARDRHVAEEHGDA